MSETNTADTSVKTVEELTTALAKAEAKIVSLKTETKAPVEPVVEEPTTPEKTEEVVVEEKPVIEPVKDPVIDNVSTTNMMGLSGTAAPVEPSTYSIDELEQMTQAEYNKAKDRISSGTATVDRGGNDL